MAEILQGKDSLYETPRVDVIEISTADVVRTSPENGGSDNGAWWD